MAIIAFFALGGSVLLAAWFILISYDLSTSFRRFGADRPSRRHRGGRPPEGRS